MPRSLKVRQEFLQLVNAALRRNAYFSQRALAEDLNLALSTVSNFLRGKPVDRAVFHELCEKLRLDGQSIVETSADPALPSTDPVPIAPTPVSSDWNPASISHRDWGEAPEVPAFFGREAELATLEQWMLGDRCRLVAILGMAGVGKTGLSIKLGSGGMGKTNLSLKLAEGIQDQFDFVIWRSLLNAPPLNALLTDVIKVLSNQHEILFPGMTDNPISRLLHYLRQYRCLIILDNAETLLEAGEIAGKYRAGYEDYGNLLRQIGEVPHQSCLLLTSREKFKEIARLEGKNRPVRSLELTGLDSADGKRIFAEVGDFLGTDAQWQQIVELYNGNPLALELAAKHIHEVFASDLSTFLRDGQPLFYDLRELLDWHFDRLSKAEQEIVYWLAINREPVSMAQLREDILSPLSSQRLPETLQSLQRKLPLEISGNRFTVQPVLMEYAGTRLVKTIVQELCNGNAVHLERYALLKVFHKDSLQQAQRSVFLASIKQQLISQLGSVVSVTRQIQQLLKTLKTEVSDRPSYAAGGSASNNGGKG